MILIQVWLIQNRPTADMHVIHCGQKVMQPHLKDYKIHLIDSLHWFQMPLSRLPKTFGLDLSKYSNGNFCHGFNVESNFDYVGPTPDVKDYNPEFRAKKERDDFIGWHTKMREMDYVFDFK